MLDQCETCGGYSIEIGKFGYCPTCEPEMLEPHPDTKATLDAFVDECAALTTRVHGAPLASDLHTPPMEADASETERAMAAEGVDLQLSAGAEEKVKR